MSEQEHNEMKQALKEWGFNETSEGCFSRKQNSYYKNDEMQCEYSVEFHKYYVRVRINILPDGKWEKHGRSESEEFYPWKTWNEPGAKANQLRNYLWNKGCNL